MGENPRGSTKLPGAILDCDARSNPKGHLQEQMISPVRSATIPKGCKRLQPFLLPQRNPIDRMGENPRGSTKSPGAILDCDARSSPKGHLQEQMISPVRSATISKGCKRLSLFLLPERKPHRPDGREPAWLDKIVWSDFGLRRQEQPRGAFAGANDQSRPVRHYSKRLQAVAAFYNPKLRPTPYHLLTPPCKPSPTLLNDHQTSPQTPPLYITSIRHV
ncbi:hypothetical protein HNR48_002080 [Pseudoteredinibacter isoporae]|uniref:Uncharacterized protein n=1 Tax=Pseudoteredinibacter isoporae TaxID=570281 RepID=A0A7X0JT52_9GAMM|nr:hypothetical protein [Pseudoteredinibacter isoporae]